MLTPEIICNVYLTVAWQIQIAWFFDGDIIGLYKNQEVAIYDRRKLREPRILVGDTVTIYGYGCGTSVMKVMQGFSTVDSYNVPALEVVVLCQDLAQIKMSCSAN